MRTAFVGRAPGAVNFPESHPDGDSSTQEPAEMAPIQPRGDRRFWLMITPAINFVCQFFIVTPSFDDLDKVLSTLGVVGALILALAVTLLSAVDFDQLTAADNRLQRNPAPGEEKYAEFWVHFSTMDLWPPSQSFALTTTGSVVLLTTAVLLDVLLYVFMGSARGVLDGVQKARAHVQWYKYARWVLLVICTFTVLGIYFFFNGLVIFIIIKFPDYEVLKDSRKRGVRGTYNTVAGLYVWGMAAVVLAFSILMGLGNYNAWAMGASGGEEGAAARPGNKVVPVRARGEGEGEGEGGKGAVAEATEAAHAAATGVRAAEPGEDGGMDRGGAARLRVHAQLS